MTCGRAAALFLFLLFTACHLPASGSGDSAARALVETGHAGPVLGLEFDEKRGLLFSAGSDGSVRIWDSRGTLQRTLEVTRLDAEKIAVNPQLSQLAVVVTDHTGAFFLSVWDWEAERQLYRVPLKEDPLFLRYSGMGTFILYGVSSWQGLKIIRAADGSAFDFHPEGFGIVGFAETSRTEKMLMTYLVSGRIVYWDMASGVQTLDFPSVPFLGGVRISRDHRFLVGSNGREVVAVDAATGAARGRFPLPGIVSLDISPPGDQIVCVTAPQAGLTVLTFKGDSLAPAVPAVRPTAAPALVCYGNDALYLADSTGGLGSITAAGVESRFTGNVLASLTGFDAGQGLLALASPTLVRVFQSDLLSGAVAPSYIRSLLFTNPFKTDTSAAFLPDGRLFAWRSDAAGPGFALLDASGIGQTGEAPATVRVLPTGFRAPLMGLQATGELLLGVETGGVLRLAELSTGISRFDVRIPGAGAAVVTAPTEIVAARTVSSASDGSLMRVNTRTGETVAVSDRNLYTYFLTVDTGGATPGLYTVGIDAAGATSLLRHDGAGLDHVTVVESVAEEDLNVSVALDPGTHRIFATLGNDRLVAGDGNGVKPLVVQNTAPRDLVARDGLLFTLNEAGTVSVLDGTSGARLAEIYLFADGEWCALFRDGRYAASPGGDVHVRVFVDGAPVKATEDFRLRIQTQ